MFGPSTFAQMMSPKMAARRTGQRRPLRGYRVRASTRCATNGATVAELGKA